MHQYKQGLEGCIAESAGFVRNRETVRLFGITRVNICDFEAFADREAIADQTAKHAMDRRFDGHAFNVGKDLACFDEVADLPETARGEGGFGSTGR